MTKLKTLPRVDTGIPPVPDTAQKLAYALEVGQSFLIPDGISRENMSTSVKRKFGDSRRYEIHVETVIDPEKIGAFKKVLRIHRMQ